VHECAHVVRGDHLVGLLQRIARMLFWPHPLVHTMSRQLARAREEICDNVVLAHGDRRRYAAALVDLAETVPARPRPRAVIGLLHPHWTMEERVRGILNERRSLMTRMNRPTFVVLVVVLLAVGIVVGAVRLEAAGDNEPAKPPDTSKPVMRFTLPSERPENRKVLDVLQKRLASVSFKDQPLTEVLDYFQTVGAINIVLDRTKVEEGNTITLKLTDVSLKTALKFVTEQAALKYVVRDGIVFISDEEGVKQAPVTAVYDVRDLLIPSGIPLTAEDSSTRKALEELVEIVKANIAPGTWDEGSGDSLRGYTFHGLLVITHVPDIHQKVQELLDMLREAKTRADAARPHAAPDARNLFGRPPVETNVYDVRDLLIRGEESRAIDDDEVKGRLMEVRLDQLITVIREVIEPGTWEAGSGNAIGGRLNSVIVTHTAEVQAKVARLLEHLRRTQSASVHEGRIITRKEIETPAKPDPKAGASRDEPMRRRMDQERLRMEVRRRMSEELRRKKEEARRRREDAAPK